MVNPDRSSPAERVSEGSKRNNFHFSQETTTVTAGTIAKKRRLVKESELVPFQKGTLSSLLLRKPSSDKVSKGKEGQSREASGGLPTALISNESRLHFQLNPNSTPTSIAELLSNHVFGPSPNLTDPRMVSMICRVIESIEQSASFTARTKEDLFRASKRQVILVSLLPFFLAFGFLSQFLTGFLALYLMGSLLELKGHFSRGCPPRY